ncbi:MAG: nucleotidyltransferase domain-containing protein [Thaumarchaeota archaeon]|nr:nucleotidyltransferase domain-containing protein [Nitrososphaerota archaeon]MCL5318694.1 nucleotidyltransferase domain-containing protein [Nitrososphaerota archaeon]
MEVPQVPRGQITVYYRPVDALARLLGEAKPDETEQCAVDFASLIKDRSGVPASNLGVSGSIKIGLHTPSSDIDIIVYGRNESMRVREALKHLLREGDPVRHYHPDEMKRLYHFRVADTKMPYDQFARHEARKNFQGIYRDREFFIRYLPNSSEIGEAYGDVKYHTEGYVKVKALVTDASESFYTPCRYRLTQVESLKGPTVPDITEVVSFRGRFCEQAETGERVVLQGKLEWVITATGSHRRVLLGGTPSDSMISLSLLNTKSS